MNSTKRILKEASKQIKEAGKNFDICYLLEPGRVLPIGIATFFVKKGYNVNTVICDDASTFSHTFVTPGGKNAKYTEEHFSKSDDLRIVEIILDWSSNSFI